MTFFFHVACDVLLSFLFCTIFSILLVYQYTAVWTIFATGGIWSLVKLSNISLHWEVGFTNWFIVVKFITSVFGVIIINTFRQWGWYTRNTHCIILFFLNINILEAMYRDMELHYFINCIVAVFLMCTIPYTVSAYEITLLSKETRKTNCFVFPLSLSWIIVYTSWNACFTYGNNMSWQTRLVLIPPFISSDLIMSNCING